MTNFEKWKETLTPESFIRGNGGETGLECSICPAEEHCALGFDYDDFSLACRRNWLNWAKEEILETNEDDCTKEIDDEEDLESLMRLRYGSNLLNFLKGEEQS
jgi:hypothetical protein